MAVRAWPDRWPSCRERCCSYFADAGGMRLVEVDEPHGLDLACYDAMACF